MLSPLPRHSGWAYYFARPPSRVSLPRYGSRVGLRIVLFEACSAFTRVTACTLALSPVRDTHSEGFSYFVTSIAAPVASGWSGRRVGLAPTGKRRLVTAHANCGPFAAQREDAPTVSETDRQSRHFPNRMASSTNAPVAAASLAALSTAAIAGFRADRVHSRSCVSLTMRSGARVEPRSLAFLYQL